MANPESKNSKSKRICLRCQTENLPTAAFCSKCSLDFRMLDYMLDCFTGNFPVYKSDNVILKSGEVSHYYSLVRLIGLKTERTTIRNYLGTRLSLGKIPIYLGKSIPDTVSRKLLSDLGSGELVVTNRRIIVVGSENNYSVKLDDIMDFELFADAVQIFHEGKRGGTFYAVDEPWRLWVVLYSKLKMEARGALLPTRDISRLPAIIPQSVLEIIGNIESSMKSVRNRQLRQTFFESGPAVFFWLAAVPPVGCVALYLNSSLGLFTKVFGIFWGLYFLGRWLMFFGVN